MSFWVLFPGWQLLCFWFFVVEWCVFLSSRCGCLGLCNGCESVLGSSQDAGARGVVSLCGSHACTLVSASLAAPSDSRFATFGSRAACIGLSRWVSVQAGSPQPPHRVHRPQVFCGNPSDWSAAGMVVLVAHKSWPRFVRPWDWKMFCLSFFRVAS